MIDPIYGKIAVALIAGATVYCTAKELKEAIVLSKPGSEAEAEALSQIKKRTLAATEGGTQGVTDAIILFPYRWLMRWWNGK